MSTFLVFGAAGALGKATVEKLRSNGDQVITAGRSNSSGCDIATDNLNWSLDLSTTFQLDGVVWAQGANSAGTVLSTSSEQLSEAFEANVGYVHKTIQQLASSGTLKNPCRGVVISSMWQEHARANKFAYLVSKAALSGLVKSVAIDMAETGFTLNAVLPGVIDTPMTRANLTEKQILSIKQDSLGGELAVPDNVAEAITWLLSEHSRGITSQFLTVDNGWTINRHV